jgi:hypothetical protein
LEQDLDLPRAINILGTWVTVKVVKEIKQQSSDDEVVWGIFEYDKDTITIKRASYSEMKRVLFHEATHAILAYSGLSEVIPNDIEEALACVSEYNAKLYDISRSPFTKYRKKRKAKG